MALETPDYEVPLAPFELDADCHVVDANGWLVAMPAEGVWPEYMRAMIAVAIRDEFNAHHYFGNHVDEGASER